VGAATTLGSRDVPASDAAPLIEELLEAMYGSSCTTHSSHSTPYNRDGRFKDGRSVSVFIEREPETVLGLLWAAISADGSHCTLPMSRRAYESLGMTVPYYLGTLDLQAARDLLVYWHRIQLEEWSSQTQSHDGSMRMSLNLLHLHEALNCKPVPEIRDQILQYLDKVEYGTREMMLRYLDCSFPGDPLVSRAAETILSKMRNPWEVLHDDTVYEFMYFEFYKDLLWMKREYGQCCIPD
jgi:hypothetical protein